MLQKYFGEHSEIGIKARFSIAVTFKLSDLLYAGLIAESG